VSSATSSEQYTHLTAQRYKTQRDFQVWTPESGTHYCTPDDGHTDNEAIHYEIFSTTLLSRLS
jgi:hypothetical protein